jgi:hypothetical protein
MRGPIVVREDSQRTTPVKRAIVTTLFTSMPNAMIRAWTRNPYFTKDFRKLGGLYEYFRFRPCWVQDLRHSTATTLAKHGKMARPAGFEPATTRLEGGCSIQLSYGRAYAVASRRE